jgi:hypothetical protein
MRNTNERATRDGAGKNVSVVETETRGEANAEPRIRKENWTMSKKNQKPGRVGGAKKLETIKVKVVDQIAAEDQAAIEKVLGKEPKAKGKKAPKEQPVAGEQAVKIRQKAPRKDGTLSGLDAAAKILADVKKPMGCKDIVETALAHGLWKTKGKTPAATVYAAIIREIAKKGKDARFKKAGRGTFVTQG